MTFARHIVVLDPSGERVLFRTHPERARAMLASGEAEVRTHGRSVHRIALTRTPGTPNRPCTPSTVRDYAGRPTTYRERLLEPEDGRMVTVGVLVQHRHIPRSAWPVYRAAVVDCLPPAAQSEIRSLFA